MSASTLETIGWINAVVERYSAMGYVLTVRQIYYQGVAASLIPNRSGSYDRVQSAVNDGRLCGLISWTAVEDRGRRLLGNRHYDSVSQAVTETAESYRTDLWAGQRFRPEVWIEKQALEGVVERVCSRLRVDFYATKGYDSQSQSWRAGRRFAERASRGQTPVVIHLGDHDPSGVDMTRDNHERLSMFAGFPVAVERVALNMDQVERYSLPNNPDNRPKVGDSRSAAYVAEYGDQGWELDALSPQVIEEIVERAVLRMRDETLWNAALAEEISDRRALEDVARSLGGGRT